MMTFYFIRKGRLDWLLLLTTLGTILRDCDSCLTTDSKLCILTQFQASWSLNGESRKSALVKLPRPPLPSLKPFLRSLIPAVTCEIWKHLYNCCHYWSSSPSPTTFHQHLNTKMLTSGWRLCSLSYTMFFCIYNNIMTLNIFLPVGIKFCVLKQGFLVLKNNNNDYIIIATWTNLTVS